MKPSSRLANVDEAVIIQAKLDSFRATAVPNEGQQQEQNCEICAQCKTHVIAGGIEEKLGHFVKLA